MRAFLFRMMVEKPLFCQLLIFSARPAVIAIRVNADSAARSEDTGHFDVDVYKRQYLYLVTVIIELISEINSYFTVESASGFLQTKIIVQVFVCKVAAL